MATILVEILGNAKQFKSELDGAVASTEKANSGFAKTAKAAGVAGLALTGGLAFGLVKSVEAADEMQQSTARMNTAFAASHVSTTKFAGAIEEAEAKSRKLGFSNDQVRGSLGSLVIATHSGRKAIADLSVAQDIARFKHVSLETATKTLTMAMAGSQRAVKQLGINVAKTTEATDAAKESYKKHLDALNAQFPATSKQTQAEHDHYLALKNTIDLNYQADKAQAKVTDTNATAARVIATVSEKLHGQATAYSETAAGGMAQFHAQLTDVAEKLGAALLPALTSVATALASGAAFFSAHTTLAKGLVVAIGALAAILLTVSVATKLYAAGQAIVIAVTGAWTASQWLLNAALAANPIGLVVIAIAALAIGLVEAYRHSETFRNIVKGALDAVLTAAQAVAGFFTGTLIPAFQSVVSWLRSNWPIIATIISGPFAPLVALATNAFGIRSALVGAFNSIKASVINIVTSMASAVYSAALDIGSSITSGIVDGVGNLAGALKDKVTGGIGSALGGVGSFIQKGSPSRLFADEVGKPIAEGVIVGWLEGSAALPSTLSTGIQNAINAGRATIQAAQASFQAAWSRISADADAALRGIQGKVQTPAEKALAAAQAAHDAAGRDQALATAQGALTTAQAGGDPAAILAAQQQLADAQYNIRIAGLQKTAEAERLQLDARNALQQTHFDDALAKLQVHLAKGHASYAEAHAAILKLFKSFGINYANAGADLGRAFVTGLKESIQDAASKSGSLASRLDTVAAGIHIPHAATGGFVSQTGLAVIHQGETITPAGQGGGVTVIVNGWVGNDQDIAEKIRNALIRTGRNTTGGVLGGF